jgi:hypothetical protein
MDARREAQQIEHEDRLTLGELNDLYAREVEEPVKPVARLALGGDAPVAGSGQ